MCKVINLRLTLGNAKITGKPETFENSLQQEYFTDLNDFSFC